MTYEVVDATGQVMRTTTRRNDTILHVAMDAAPAGLYLLRMRTATILRARRFVHVR
jgi:hypothetical protein